MLNASQRFCFPNPKVTSTTKNADNWYRYYAGYSSEFVTYALGTVAPHAKTVLDPWNGTGTTTVVAAGRRLRSFGFDVNPVAVVIARARLLGSSVRGSIRALTLDIVGHATPVRLRDDPLLFWFSSDSAAQLRAIELSIHRLLVDSADSVGGPLRSAENLSGLAAFFYTALFRTVRALAIPAGGTNPTWWKRPSADNKLKVPKRVIRDTFTAIALDLGEGLHRQAFDLSTSAALAVGDSRRLPLPDNSIGAVVTSPPYCTRMDYAIATRPELAILRYGDDELTALRTSMVGTPTMTGEDAADDALGPEASAFLAAVTRHSSQASAGYYRKFYRQYYAAMKSSLTEIRRVTMPGAPVMLVVQDGYYKELHNDVPAIVADIALHSGFSSSERYDFRIPRTIAGMNSNARKYRQESSAVESVVLLQ